MISWSPPLVGGVPYTELKYDKAEVRAVGEAFRRSDPKRQDHVALTPEQLEAARAILDNWRAAHTRPLIAFRMNLQQHVKRVVPQHEAPVVAQRIKREESIVLKLQRLEWLHLDRMQDIGGVRAVVSTVAQVRRLRALHRQSKSRNEFVKEDDYLDDKPKASGYRGIHLIYAFHCPGTSWHGLNAEIQLRTFLQHQWATANEVVGYGRGEKFKSGEGDSRWLRMFTLIGAAFAQLEKTKAITESPKTFGPVPPTLAELRPLIAQLDEDIKFRECVASYGVGFKAIDQSKAMKNRYWFLLRLDIQKRELNIRSYKVRDIRTAEKHLAEAERERESGAIIDVCLVSVHDMRNLRRAYPNYHLDTTRFLARLNTVLNGASASSASA